MKTLEIRKPLHQSNVLAFSILFRSECRSNLAPNRAFQGTYSVSPDCSGTLTLNIPGLTFSMVYDIVVVSHGREFQSIVASPQPVMVSTTGRKMR